MQKLLTDYCLKHNLKPLSKKELNRGKDKIKISNTDEPMPWDTIYTRMSLGEPVENIAEVYGHIRKIVLWAIQDKITYNESLGKVLVAEVDQRRTMDNLEAVSPIIASTIRDVANEYAPDAARKSVTLAVSLIDSAQKQVNEGDLTATDRKTLMEMLQKGTDILGLTERHAAGVNLNTNHFNIEGFSIVEDLPPIDVVEEQNG